MKCARDLELLSAWSAGDLDEARSQEWGAHVAGCADCQARLRSLQCADERLRLMAVPAPPAGALLAVRRALDEHFAAASSEILTLAEVAAYLRVAEAEVQKLLAELPAFEVAGQIRVRREKLKEWVAQRERAHLRGQVLHELAAGLSNLRIPASGVPFAANEEDAFPSRAWTAGLRGGARWSRT